MNGFLFDQNLPVRLTFVPSLSLIHATALGQSPSDSQIWLYAKEHELVIVTKDADFSGRIILSQPPPRVVHLRFGNPGCVWEINRASVSEKGCSAKATEAEAGQPARAAEDNAGPAPFLASLVERQRWAGLFHRHTLRRAAFHARLAAVWPEILRLLPENKLINVYSDRIEAVT